MTVLDEPGGASRADGGAGAPAVVVAIEGHVDIYNAVELRESLLAALGAEAPGVVLDLTDLKFVDSTAIGIIVGACRRAQASGKWIEAFGAAPQVRRTLAMAGVDRLLDDLARHS